jgi:sporulation protein YlmC with PRC-barrel domain
MKLQHMHLIGSVLIVTCSLHHAMGAPTASQTMTPIVVFGKSPTAPKLTGEIDTRKQIFTELIGMQVFNFQNEKLGRIHAITTDLHSSRLVEVLVSSPSGLMGLRQTITPVPPTAIKVDTDRENAYLNVSKARFAAAPKLAKLNPAYYSQTDRAAASSRYFGVAPWYLPSGLGYVETSDNIELMQIKNPQGKYLGKVGRIMMDLPTGRIRQIVDDTESMDGNGNHILPQGSLTYNARHTALVMNANFSQIVAKPHFRWDQGTFGEQEFVEEVVSGRNAPVFLTNEKTAPAARRSGMRLASANKPARISAPGSSEQKQKTLVNRASTAKQVASR